MDPEVSGLSARLAGSAGPWPILVLVAPFLLTVWLRLLWASRPIWGAGTSSYGGVVPCEKIMASFAVRAPVGSTPRSPSPRPSGPDSKSEALARIKAEVEHDLNHLNSTVTNPRTAYLDAVRELWGGEIPPGFLK